MMEAKQTSLVPYILFGMFILEIFFLFVKKIDGNVYGIFDAIEKLYPIIAIMLLIAFMKPRLSFHWWMALAFYGTYVLYGILISLAQQKGIKIILVQLYHEMKYFPMIFLFSVARCDDRWAKWTLKIIKPIIIFTVVLILFQIAVPGGYDAVFKNGGHFEKAHIGGILLPRLVGLFWHPGQTALFFLIAAVFFIVEYQKRNIKFGFSMVTLCVLFVMLSIQRFELFILFVVLMAFWFRRYIHLDYQPFLSALIFILFAGGILYLISDQAHFWTLIEDFHSPRTVFLVEALFTLVDTNYWGAGWGTIGSHTAADVANVYEFNSMKDIWWVKLELYFYDTYWPHVIGETGLPGFFLLLLSMVFMIRALKSPEASILLFVLILTSALSSNAQSLYHLTVFGWFIMLLENDHNNPLAQHLVQKDTSLNLNYEGVK